MVTLSKYGAKYNRNILFLEGLSTDTKPTDEFDGLSIQNGSEYTEVDTGKKFLFDYDNATWYEVQAGGGGGGGGGTSNYNDLSNRPSVNNTVLAGNKTSAQLGLASSEQGGKADTAIQGIKVNSSTVNPDANKVVNITVPTTAADVSALPDTTKYAAALSLTINSSTFVMTGQLKDQNGDNLGTAQTIDLPLESVVVGGSYNSQTKKVVLTLQNGNTIEFSVADLVSGLQTELSASNKLNPAYINYDSTHRAVSDTEKSTWNGKQNAIDSSHKLSADLVDDTSTTNKFATAAELEQIETNKNNILSNYGGTIDKNILNTTITVANDNDVTFTLNDDKSITVNGTNRFTTAAIPIELGSFTPVAGKTYVCKGTGDANIKIQIFDGTGLPANSSDDATFTAQAGTTYSARVWIAAKPASGTQFNNLKIYPMICEQSIYTADSSYQPYILSNRETSDAIQAIQSWIAAQS